jgi:hypothetical protein
MTIILVTKPRSVKQFLQRLDGYPAGIECCGGRFDQGSEPPAGRHVKAPRSRATFLHRGFEGSRPRAVLVDDRGFAGPREREREVAVNSFRALREYAVDLQDSLDHRRVGEWWNAVERQDPSEHASLSVQPHHGQSPAVDVRLGQDLRPQTLSSAADVMGVDERGVDGMAAASPGMGTLGATFHRRNRRATTRATRLDDEKAPPVGDRGAFTSVSEGRHATCAHVSVPTRKPLSRDVGTVPHPPNRASIWSSWIE